MEYIDVGKNRVKFFYKEKKGKRALKSHWMLYIGKLTI